MMRSLVLTVDGTPLGVFVPPEEAYDANLADLQAYAKEHGFGLEEAPFLQCESNQVKKIIAIFHAKANPPVITEKVPVASATPREADEPFIAPPAEASS